MISRGLDLARPALNIPSLFSDKATALLPRLDTDCLGQLTAQNEFGGLAPAEVFRADADLGPVAPALDAEDDAENLTIRSAVRIEQGTADTTVLPPFTDQTVQALKGRGTPVVYKTYPGVDHGSIVAKAQADATSWIRSRLGNPRRSS
jgi:hypothetical protein